MSRDYYDSRARLPFDPAPRNGLVEEQACMTMARFGYWPAQFRDFISRYYAGRIPTRFTQKVAELRAKQPWALPELSTNEGRYRIHKTIDGIAHVVTQEPENSSDQPSTEDSAQAVGDGPGEKDSRSDRSDQGGARVA